MYESLIEVISFNLFPYTVYEESLSLYGSISLVDLGRFFGFLILYTVGRLPWRGDQPAARPLPTHRTTQTQKKHRQTPMPRVGSETTIPVFEGAEKKKKKKKIAAPV
jgi:hypothetical protein